eukprot:gene27299-32974_t
MAGSGAIEHWPYFFFRTGSGTVLAWYVGQVKYRYLNILDHENLPTTAAASPDRQHVEMSPTSDQQPV